MKSYWVKRAIQLDREVRQNAALLNYREQEARYDSGQDIRPCVLCDKPATHECSSGIGWVCDSDHAELDD